MVNLFLPASGKPHKKDAMNALFPVALVPESGTRMWESNLLYRLPNAVAGFFHWSFEFLDRTDSVGAKPGPRLGK